MICLPFRLGGLVLAVLLAWPTSEASAQTPTVGEAWGEAIEGADSTWRAFRKAREAGDADAMRRMAQEIRRNPLAVQRFNTFASQGDIARVKQIHESIQSATKDLVRKRLMKEYDVPAEAIEFFEATNKPSGGRPRLGQDWDVTVRVNGTDLPIRVDPTGAPAKPVKVRIGNREVDIDPITDAVEEAYFEATHGRPPTGADEAAEFADDLSVEVTDRFHPESYGSSRNDTRAFFDGPEDARLRDPEQIADAMRYKSHRPAAQAEDILDSATRRVRDLGLSPDSREARQIMRAARVRANSKYLERNRQFIKQWDKHIAPRVKALGGRIPDRLEKAVDAIRLSGSGGMSPAEARRRLADLGLSMDDLIDRGPGLFDAAHRLRPPKPGPSALGKLAKTGGAVLTVLEVLNETSRAAEKLRERAAMEGRDFDWIGSDGIAVAQRTADNMVIKPLDALTTALIRRNAEIMGEEFADVETMVSVDGAKAFGSGVVRITKRFTDATTSGLDMAGQFAKDGAIDLYEDPMGTMGQATDAIIAGIGEVFINSTVRNAYYDADADRRSFDKMREVAQKTAGRINRLTRELDELRRRIARTPSDTERRILKEEYARKRDTLTATADNWRDFRRKALDENNPVGKEIDKAMAPTLTEAARVPSPVEMVEVENIEACTKFMADTVDRIAGLLEGETPSRLASLSAFLYDRKGHQDLMDCICARTSSGSMGVRKYYAPEGVDRRCGGPKNAACINEGYGCWRHPVRFDADILRSCNAAYKVARAICRREYAK